ncbi:hypothetical protein KDW_18730 [Dictyobacter vulcani]|uniref:PPM-type phosphatase domain-containing protein n=1 Tax=Dictyobacter vulcani TaxID=2607529 RepID=A0A5J4KN16_9CHLR|nr:protein phosphatase 2C domain-containing protein [Dictyobacter vulcani]GER87711.1 hypothetical protein KDW_18730 [Dictyobacter vulcani]
MYAQVTRLQCWKSEHNDQSCEDAFALSLSQGLLTVADGVGTTLFSNIWARHLVDHFLATPLLSDDPFEVEWWLRAAQEHFQKLLPGMEGLPWNALQKMQNEGSFSTLAALRIFSAHPLDGEAIQAKLLAFGDSCIFVQPAATAEVFSFPIVNAADFDRPPISLPSKPGVFNRHFQKGMALDLLLRPGDRILLATDAVARWIVGASERPGENPRSAFQAVAEQTMASWPDFIASCRASSSMVDDDCTALLVKLHADTEQIGEPLGLTSLHHAQMRARRKTAFLQAVQEQNKELAAIYYGDGQDLAHDGVVFPDDQWRQARDVADALREVLAVMRREINSPLAVQKITPVWRKYAPFLLGENCAASVCKTLQRLGIALEEPATSTATSFSRNQPMVVVVKSQQQVQLEDALLQALWVNDDAAIVQIYDALQPLPYASEFIAANRAEERIQQAVQLEYSRRGLRYAIASKNIEQISMTSDLLGRDLSFLSMHEQQLVMLAHQWMDAWRLQDSNALLRAFEAIARSPYSELLLFSEREKAYLQQLFRQRQAAQQPQQLSAPSGPLSSPSLSMAPVTSLSQPSMAMAPVAAQSRSAMPASSGVPAISEYWFRKVCVIKRAYLLHWVYQKVSDSELEQITLDDLVNAPLVHNGILQANRSGSSVPLLPEVLLPDIFQAFKSNPMINYGNLVQEQGLSDGQIKEILLIFLNRQLFEDYLLWEQSLGLEDWLQITHGCGPEEFRYRIEQACPWVISLRWWKG